MIGSTISHYRILEKLGAGGMGEVYKAEDTRLRRIVALKFLSEELSHDADAVERFSREALAASAINHPHICVVYDIGEHDGRRFIAMEFLEGMPLNRRIARGVLPTEQVIEVGIQLSDALEAAHAHGILHRDIKPGQYVRDRERLCQAAGLRVGEASVPNGRVGWRDSRATHVCGCGGGNARVHVPGTSSRRIARRSKRPVFARRRALRDGHGSAGVRRRDSGHDPRVDSESHPAIPGAGQPRFAA